ncbi:MAG: hypothetical protein PHT07_00085 [Paludibacter sp.]|nr:hypothetical protein [Paludibacter sp.]
MQKPIVIKYNTRKMIGTWIGTYKLVGHPNVEYNERETFFTVIISEYDGVNFKGTVTDDLESGGTKGDGLITGKVRNGKIEFIKQMPVLTLSNKEGKRVEFLKKHKPIYYSGVLNNGTFEGKWKIKRGIIFNKSIVSFTIQTNGEWRMHKTI